MHCKLVSLDLPPDVKQGLLGLAKRAELLLFGELHGSQEVPRLMAGLLPQLGGLGYGGLALEVPYFQRESLAGWAASAAPTPPEFFASPTADGRGNFQALALVERAVASGWQILCFDNGPDRLMQQWTDRDSFMADNLVHCSRIHGPDCCLRHRKPGSARSTPYGKVSRRGRVHFDVAACSFVPPRFAARIPPDDGEFPIGPLWRFCPGGTCTRRSIGPLLGTLCGNLHARLLEVPPRVTMPEESDGGRHSQAGFNSANRQRPSGRWR